MSGLRLGLRVFIVDDELPARVRLKTLLSDIAILCPHELVGEADNAESALRGIASARPDLVLLDVQMPGATGIDMADALANQGVSAPAVIFVSAYDHYALKAFEVHAVDYLLKPVRAARLAEALQRVSARLRQAPLAAPDAIVSGAASTARQYFSVQDRGRLLMVPIADVLYLKAEQKYVTLRTKTSDYLIEEALVSIENELAATFVRVHRNALVARAAIIGVERAALGRTVEPESDKSQDVWEVILRGVAERIPVSRRQLPTIKDLVR